MKKKSLFYVLGVMLPLLVFCPDLWAQRRASVRTPRSYNLTYDLGVSAGSYGGYSYTELNVGLNWYLTQFLNWRNAVFSRFGSQIDSATGLDTSLRFEFRESSQDGELGVHLFAGPGYRISNKTNSAGFAEGGAIFRLGGFSLGAGVKVFSYSQPGKDVTGKDLPSQDINYFLIIAGGGAI